MKSNRTLLALAAAAFFVMGLPGCDFRSPRLSGRYTGQYRGLDCTAIFEGKNMLRWNIKTDGEGPAPHLVIYSINEKAIVSEGRVIAEIKTPSTIDFFASGTHITITKQQ